jgi:hypothetical protein
MRIQCFTEYGNFSNPASKFEYFEGTLKECIGEFNAWKEMHLKYYDLAYLISFHDSPGICANGWRGTDCTAYPDFQLVLGPHGGIRKIET